MNATSAGLIAAGLVAGIVIVWWVHRRRRSRRFMRWYYGAFTASIAALAALNAAAGAVWWAVTDAVITCLMAWMCFVWWKAPEEAGKP